MADTDLIARIYPYGEELDVQREILKAFTTSSCYHPPQVVPPRPQAAYRRGERQPTEPPEHVYVSQRHHQPCIELRFGIVPRSRYGIVFGTDPDSDVVLPNYKGIGYHHFTLTFDEVNRLVVKDFGSRIGTEVTYNDQGQGRRSGFHWIVSGHYVLQNKKRILINIKAARLIQLQIVVAQHNIQSLAYIAKVNQFRYSNATTEELFSDLGIPNRPETEWPTGSHTPGTGKIYIRKEIGEGTFAVVTHSWNVSTGEEFALKKPSVKAFKHSRVNAVAWKNEAHIMGLISHPNIVKLLWSDFTQDPVLCLEYVPCGCLTEQENLSPAECESVLRQCLSALKYMHGGDPPIVHRDIKPDNVLVQYRGPRGISIKLGDFGISRDYDNLSTICGNLYHLAPEIYQNQQYIAAGGKERVSYTAAVNIWSLGVVVYSLLCPLPRYTQSDTNNTTWCKKIITTFNGDLEERPDELRGFLLEAMVVLWPEKRWSAQDCYARAEHLPDSAMDCYKTLRRASHINEDERTTISYQDQLTTVGGPHTVVSHARSSNCAIVPNDATPYQPARSGSRASVKRPTTVSASSSASRRPGKRRDDHSSVEASGFQLEDRLNRPGSSKIDPAKAAVSVEQPQYVPAMHGKQPIRLSLQLDEQSQSQFVNARLWNAFNGFARDQDDSGNSDDDSNLGTTSKLPSTAAPSMVGEQRVSLARVNMNNSAQSRLIGPHVNVQTPYTSHPAAEEYLGSATEVNTPSIASTLDFRALATGSGQYRASPHDFSGARADANAGASQQATGQNLNTFDQSRPLLEISPEATHLSTRELFHCEGLVYMVVRRLAVSMRKSDFQLNASQICTAAGLQQNETDTKLNVFRMRGIGGTEPDRGRSNYWVPFSDGLFLCHAVGLENDLRPLLSYSSLPPPNQEETYFRPAGFATLRWCECDIAYQSSKRTVNASHLLKARDVSYKRLPHFFATNPGITRDKLENGPNRYRGSYIPIEKAHVLCRFLGMPSTPVQWLFTGGTSSTSAPSV